MNTAEAVIAMLASAVIVLGGLLGVMRALLRLRDDLHDNKTAIKQNTDAITRIDNRLLRLEQRRRF